MPGGPLEVGYGVSYLSIAIPVRGTCAQCLIFLVLTYSVYSTYPLSN